LSIKQADLSSLRIDSSKRDGQTESPKNRKKIVSGILVLLALAAIVFAAMYAKDFLFSKGLEVSLTGAFLQSPSQAEAVLTASGYVVAQRKASVASKGTGRLVYLGVVEGDIVKKEQVIARLEDNDIRAQLAETNANLKLQQADLKVAENEYQRQKSLFETGVASQAELDDAETHYRRVLASIDLARAQVQAAEVALENTLIRAPFDGTVLTKNADVGEIVAPLAASANSRAAVVTIADMSSLQVEADVSESNIEKIQVEQNCEITLDAYPSFRYAGYVAKIVPTADRAKATVQVKVGFKNYDRRVLPEMSAKVLFLNPEENSTAEIQQPVLVIPQTALANRNGKAVVYQVKDNRAVEVEISTGQTFAGYVEIKAGLNNGDRVINPLTDQITNGVKVSIK
jgi:RND family efflux transporter MFP subunit